MATFLEPRFETSPLFDIMSIRGPGELMDMKSPILPPFNGVDEIPAPSDDECSSVIGTISSLEGTSRDEMDEMDDNQANDSDFESFPHELKGTRTPSLSGYPYHDPMIPSEYFVRLNARFRHNLTSIREERDEALKRWSQAQAMNTRLVETLRAERAKQAQLEERFKSFRSTEIVNIPVWPPHAPLTPPMSATGTNNDEEIVRPDRSMKFLYDNPLYQGYELNVNIIIFRIKTLIEDKRPGKASLLIEEALEKAQKLKYTPIHAKCLYWKGRILHLQGQRQGATRAFLNAMPCIGKYREGEELKTWLMRYEVYIEELSSGQQVKGPAVVRKRPPRYMCVPAADLPPTP